MKHMFPPLRGALRLMSLWLCHVAGRRGGKAPGGRRFASGPLLAVAAAVCAAVLLAAGPPPVRVGAQDGEDETQNLNDEDLAYYNYNFARAAYASSSHGSGLYPPAAIVNGDRKGVGWGAGRGGWNDGTPNEFPDYVEVHFDGEKAIDRIDIFSLQDDYTNPVEPRPEMTFTRYGIVDFNVSYFDSEAGRWELLAAVRNNNLVWRQIHFDPVRTQKLSIAFLHALSVGSANNWSRLVEVEASGSLSLQPPPPPAPSPTATPNPCGGPGAEPCHMTVNLYDAVRNRANLTYRAGHPDSQFRSAWRNQLNWSYGRWTGGGSKNKPALAHALALWRSSNPNFRNEWDDPGDDYPNPDPVAWWLDYLRCQNGGACAQPEGSSLRYIKADETLSNTYDADTTRAVVAAYHWTIKETIQGRRTAPVAQLADQAMIYLRYTWGLYALSAGPGPAESIKHRGNQLKPPTGQRCQYNSNGYWYDGPFLALAGMRSAWGHLCSEDRGPMFTRALLPEWNTQGRGVPAGAPVNLSRETNAQRNLLNEIQAQQETWKAQHPDTYPAAALNAYGLDAGQRRLITEHIMTGNSGQFFRDFLAGIRLRVKYHFLGWVDTSDQQVRLTVMESNANKSTIATYAVLYRHATRTAEALLPWEFDPKQKLLPECFRNDECRASQDTSENCYFSAQEKKECWTRPEREDVTAGQAFLANGINQPAPTGTTPVKVWGSNIATGENPKPSGKFDVHGTIMEEINGLNIPSAASGRRRYHIVFYKDRAPEMLW